ncbi:hypothetical protein MM236_00580 [Belliella sp. DSM 107340]|uniref:Uncharacterized protein n=1 Tax=Belliella calami TaxID=2923436 RepID=A0ABS9UIK8_9BACT|nr:hypothetical protein [Belliella calami]MCH7396454.1 hypothetical protein [Belliella calami]
MTTPEKYPYEVEQNASKTEMPNWHSYFYDPNLDIHIDSALFYNQVLNITQQELAINGFEAQVLNTKNLQFEVLQKIIETESRIKLLVGMFHDPIPQSSKKFKEIGTLRNQTEAIERKSENL